MSASSFFVTGTSTGVGKTHFSCMLLAALQQSGRTVTGFKPVCCGDGDDVRRLMDAGNQSESEIDLDELNPLWFKAPASPLAAAKIENREFCLQDLLQSYEKLQQKYEGVVTEGIGGWEVPLTTNQTVADLAALIAAPSGQPPALTRSARPPATPSAIRTKGFARHMNFASEASDRKA